MRSAGRFTAQKQTTFSLVLSRYSSSHTIKNPGGTLSDDENAETSLRALRLKLEACICALRAEADASTPAAQQRNKRDYDRLVRVIRRSGPATRY